MDKLIIYHNTRCSKSRCALELIEAKTKDFHIVEYLKNPPSEKELKIILKKLGLKAEEIIRKKEPLFEKKFLGKSLTEEEWIKVLTKNPILIERPIIVKGKKAVIARPPEKALSLL